MERKEKLVLIDGNSLLNRAFYAMAVFSTKDGLPTNGIFGFVKLLLRIIDDEKPDYLVSVFDVHAPTFRHKMFDDYKGTRKPMPEELVAQVPVLKELLQAMNICTMELAGYEADDIIGTLSRKFGDVETVIFTGDRDAFQLVKEGVSVCFTKRGVSDVDRLTAENFFGKTGLTPAQIIEQKALMGDSSDNIPGVKGIGDKTAMSLLTQYSTIDNVYQNLSQIRDSWRTKLEAGRELAYLSRELATIDVNVPISFAQESCRLSLPFPEEARAFFARLEFRSLVNSEYFPTERKMQVETVTCQTTEEIWETFENCAQFAFYMGKDYHLYCEGKEFIFPIRDTLLEAGFFPRDLSSMLARIFSSQKRAIVAERRALKQGLGELGIEISCPVEDVALLRYVVDSNQRPSDAVELAKDYAIPEENCAYALLRAFDEAIASASEEEKKLYRDLELPLSDILMEMEGVGVRVDVAKFPEFTEKFGKEMADVAQKIFSIAGETFNLNSPFKISEILFEKLGYPTLGAKKNIRGGYSTSADILEKLAERHEIARHILRYRELQKLQSTYIDGMQPLVEQGIVHTTYNQTSTTTGRLSSANPNLQNIPVRKQEGRELRKLFLAHEGNVLVDADYSQIELRLLAHFSGCQPLIEAYNEGRDIHAITASQVFGVKLADVTSEMRRRAKAVNFGIIYGISAFGLAKDLGCSQSEASEYIERYFNTYTAVREYMDENVKKAKADGYVTTILGRKRYIPELKSSNYNMRSFGERAAMNMPLQGSSADIIKLAMVAVDRRLKEEKMQTKMIMQVHDELVLDAPIAEEERAKLLLKEEMEGAVSLRVPLIVDVSTGVSWFDAKQ